MPTHIVCPGCGKALGIPEDALGKQVRCAACQLVFVAEITRDEPAPMDAPGASPAAPIAATPLKPEKPQDVAPEAPPVLSEAIPATLRQPARKQPVGKVAGLIIGLMLLVGGLALLGCGCGVGWWFLRVVPEQERGARAHQLLLDLEEHDRQKEYTYPVRVKAKRGGLKYRIEAGPDDMKVSANGTVTWHVPADHAEGPIDVIMTVGDSTGQEVFHTFRVQVADRPAEKE